MRILVNRLYPRGDKRASDAVHSNPNLAPRTFVDFVPLGPLRNLIDITLHPRRAGLYCGGFWLHPVSPLSSLFDPFPMSLVSVFSVVSEICLISESYRRMIVKSSISGSIVLAVWSCAMCLFRYK